MSCFRLLIYFLVVLSTVVSINAQRIESGFKSGEFRKKREKMVRNQIVTRGIRNDAVIESMRTVQRHLFVPDNYTKEAYRDHPLPIGFGQTISQPYIVAYMTEITDVDSTSKVLEIGTGSGYQAAVLAVIVDSVFTVEIIGELGRSAKDRLKSLNYTNVKARVSDGYYGWKEHAPFDAIVVTAAAEHIPPPLIEQLKEGGKLIIPVGHPFFVQNLILVEKDKGKVISRNMMPVRFVPLRGEH